MTQNRREFLASSAAFAMSAPLLQTSKTAQKRPVVGSGDYKFECEHDWAMKNLPKGHQYGGASHGIAVDEQGLIYISHTGKPGSVFVFEPNGKFVRSMAKQHQGSGHGIDIRKESGEEFIYLAPANPKMGFTKMNLKGEVLWVKDRKAVGEDSGLFEKNPKLRFRPTNVSFRPDGGYYLGDGYGSNFLFEYDAKDKFVRAIGGGGSKDGKFKTPHGQWLDNRDGTPKLVVADRANKRLQWFDMEGKHVHTLDGFLFPADIDVQGDMMLVPDLHARVTLLDKANKVVAQFGDDEKWRASVLGNRMAMRSKRDQWQSGKFVHPHDACFDKDGNIFVAEWVVTGRVTKLVRV